MLKLLLEEVGTLLMVTFVICICAVTAAIMGHNDIVRMVVWFLLYHYAKPHGKAIARWMLEK